jgi:cell division protein ZapE
MTPLQRYQSDLRRDGFVADKAQKRAIRHTDKLYHELLAPRPEPDQGLVARLLKRPPAPAAPVKGLYFWGGVGRGKTYLIDAFYECLPLREKTRIHFHSFMQRVHRELKALKDVSSPLNLVAECLAKDVRVLCFDEFHVSDITDAMLLGNLLKALFDRQVTLVTTSNEHPDKLYWGGLQRDRFLPAIELIKRHTEVIHVDSGVDYRLRALEKAEIYHTPLDDSANRSLAQSFEAVAPDAGETGGTLEVDGRAIPTLRHADGVVWFDFETICGGPRAASDYIEIARCFQTVLVSDIPQLDEMNNDAARRFIHLVDEFYDRGVKLIVSAACSPRHLYTGKRLQKLFERTISRLEEMQSRHYLARQHISD